VEIQEETVDLATTAPALLFDSSVDSISTAKTLPLEPPSESTLSVVSLASLAEILALLDRQKWSYNILQVDLSIVPQDLVCSPVYSLLTAKKAQFDPSIAPPPSLGY
jgi:hypothetical protein